MTNNLLTLDLSCVAGGASVALDDGGVSNGRRYLSGYLNEEGRVGGCRFGRLHVNVAESGLGDWFAHATRTLPGSTYGWQALTDQARAKVNVEVTAQVEAVGFGAAWAAAFQRRRWRSEAAGNAAEAHRVARWWEFVAGLEGMMGDGCYRVEPIVVAHDEYRGPRVDVVDYQGRVSWAPVFARLVSVSIGGPVGWVTDSGRLVPLETVAPLRPAETHDEGLRAVNAPGKLGV